MKNQIIDLLKNLNEYVSPSGHEHNLLNFVKSLIQDYCDESYFDPIDNLQSVKPVVTGKADMKVLDEYYNSKEYDKYSQAAAITHCMDKFREAAYMYVEYARGDRDNTKFGFTAEYVVDEAHFVYDYRFEEGEAAYLAHRELDPENEKLYQDCKDEIRMIMTHYLLMTDEEFDDCFETENYYTLDYAEIIKERTGYFEY